MTNSLNFSLNSYMYIAAILRPIIDKDIVNEVETTYPHKTIFKDSAVLGTLIGVCLFIILVIVVLALLTKLGYSPGSKLVQSKISFKLLLSYGILELLYLGSLLVNL